MRLRSAASGSGPLERRHVLPQVRELGRRRDRAVTRGMRHDPLQEHRRPRRRADLRAPSPAAALRLHAPNCAPPSNGRIDDHGRASLRGERQQPLLRFAVAEVVRHLEEVEALAPDELLAEVVAPSVRGGDADVALGARRPSSPSSSGRCTSQSRQVVHLHQVEARDLPQVARALHLAAAREAAHRPDLGGARRAQAWRRCGPAPRRSPPPTIRTWARSRRGVRRTSKKARRMRRARLPARGVRDIEGDPGTQADDGDALAARGHRAGERRVGRSGASAGKAPSAAAAFSRERRSIGARGMQ
jgi:hypothetical protein